MANKPKLGTICAISRFDESFDSSAMTSIIFEMTRKTDGSARKQMLILLAGMVLVFRQVIGRKSVTDRVCVTSLRLRIFLFVPHATFLPMELKKKTSASYVRNRCFVKFFLGIGAAAFSFLS